MLGPGPVPLESSLVEDIVGSLGCSPPTLDIAGLGEVYSAWCRSVPFDNLRKLIALEANAAVLPELDAATFFADWRRDGAGGTCWSSNNALHSLLVALGFDADAWSGSMFDGDPNHATTVVTIEGERWLVDTAVHGDLPVPVRAGESSEVDFFGYTTRVRHDERGPLLDFPTPDPDFTIPCRLFGVINHSFSVDANERSRAWSPFNGSIMAGLNDATGAWMLNGLDLTRVDASGFSTHALSVVEVDEFLIEVVGCSEGLVRQVRAAGF